MSATFTPLQGPFNLPTFIFAHATTFVGLGLYLVFRRPSTPTPNNPKPFNPFTIPPGRADELSRLIGFPSLGLGLSYLWTSYVPVEKNQFLYMTVPVRLVLAVCAGLRLLVDGRGMSAEGRREMAGIVIYDAISVMVLGWWLGEGGFSGRPPVY